MNSLKRKRESRQLLCPKRSIYQLQGHELTSSFEMRTIEKLPFSNLTVDLQHRARSRAFFIPITTSENERFLRTYHQSLEPHQIVYRIKDVRGHEMWAISFEGSAPVHDTYAAGLPIHVLPSFIVPPRVPQQRLLNDPIIGVINPREILSLGNLYLIHTFFPNSIGVRILVTGFIIILYKSMKDLKDAWTQGVLETVGTLQVGYSVAVYVPTATSIGYGSAVTTKEDGDMYENQGCLGLRIRLPNGNEAITTTTHAFVRLMATNDVSRVRYQASDWLVRTVRLLRELKPVQRFLEIPAVSRIRQKQNSSLSQRIFLAGTDTLVGIITDTFDPHPAAHLPFPSGFHHDLSLITNDNNLPDVVSPPGYPTLIGWASHQEILRGAPVFTCRHNVMTGRWRTLAGRGITTNVQRAIVEGTEFTWNKGAYAQNSAILWRSELDHETARAFSGSVLCSGLPSDATARAVVFQNYEAALKDEFTLNDCQVGLTGITNHATFKGGFILPDEITSSEIVMSCEKGPKPFNSIQKAFKTNKHLTKSRATSGPA